MDIVVVNIRKSISSKIALNREQAVCDLQSAVKANGGADQTSLWTNLEQVVSQLLLSEAWEERCGGFMLAKAVVQLTPQLPDTFAEELLDSCTQLLEDGEPRVRVALGECLSALAGRLGTSVYERCGGAIVASIKASCGRDPEGEATMPEAEPQDFLASLLESSYRTERPGEGDLRHGTEGWGCLESSLRALEGIMGASGAAFLPFLTPELRELVFCALLHQSRFVRETGYRTVEAICVVCAGKALQDIGPELAERLADGLSDSWSHVRYAACVATRTFMVAAEGWREEVFPQLLPPMCLNRRYEAEGVRLYSQKTWALIMGDEGRHWVARCAPQVVQYYARQSRASNHEVREAACEGMAELVAKIEPDAVRPLLPQILSCLLSSFKDASWPVRDAACLACGQYVLAYPDEARASLDKLYALWFDHLCEIIPSVRAGAAAAIANSVRAYGDEALASVLLQLRQILPRAKSQPPDAGQYVTNSYGIAAARMNELPPPPSGDDALFGGDRFALLKPDLYSSAQGSRPPVGFSTSMLTKQPNDCCMDETYERPRQPWEASDGGVLLLKELASASPASVPEFMPLVAELAALDSFSHACHLQETIWRQLPSIARSLGKRDFKRHLEPFIEPLFRSLSRSGHNATETAAGDAIAFLRDWLGPRIFAGRLSEDLVLLMQTDVRIPGPAASALMMRPETYSPVGMPYPLPA